MNLMSVHFTLPLFLFQAVYSEISEVSNSLNEVWSGIDDDEELVYGNTSFSSVISNLQELDLKKAQLNFEKLRLEFGNEMFRTIINIEKLNLNITKQCTKILGNIEEVYNSVLKSVKKKIDLLNKGYSAETNIFEDFYRYHESELLKEEWVTFLAQLKTLKFEIYHWDKCPPHLDMTNYVENLVMKIQDNEETTEIFLNETNDEAIEDPPEFDNAAHIDKLERLQRLALMIKDQLYEMPKPKNDDEDDAMDSEKSESSKKQKVPRWLLTEKDIDEIRTTYITWMKMLEESKHPNVVALKEVIKERGYSTKLFCKTLSEYFNFTSMALECTSKDDNECIDMLMEIFAEKHFKKFQAVIEEMETLNIFLSR